MCKNAVLVHGCCTMVTQMQWLIPKIADCPCWWCVCQTTQQSRLVDHLCQSTLHSRPMHSGLHYLQCLLAIINGNQACSASLAAYRLVYRVAVIDNIEDVCCSCSSLSWYIWAIRTAGSIPCCAAPSTSLSSLSFHASSVLSSSGSWLSSMWYEWCRL